MCRSVLIGAAASGCGKTTFTAGLLRVLRHRGLKVQPFKCGPDYIDPLYHRQASGVASVNLDTFMASPEHVRALFDRYGRGAEVATLLKLPVLLLVSAQSVAYSVAPLIYGFRHFWPELQLAGVVFNFVASERQYDMLRQACGDAGAECFGYLSRNAQLTVPSRHLGLTVQEQEQMERLIASAAEEIERHVDVDRLLTTIKTQQDDDNSHS